MAQQKAQQNRKNRAEKQALKVAREALKIEKDSKLKGIPVQSTKNFTPKGMPMSQTPPIDVRQLKPQTAQLIEVLQQTESAVLKVSEKEGKKGLHHRTAPPGATLEANEFMKLQCALGEELVFHLVQWVKHLPFFTQLSSVEHTYLLKTKWLEILLLCTLTQAMYFKQNGSDKSLSFEHCAHQNLLTLQECMNKTMDLKLDMDAFRAEMGEVVEKVTKLAASFRTLGITRNEYLLIKVIIFLAQGKRSMHCLLERHSEFDKELIRNLC